MTKQKSIDDIYSEYYLNQAGSSSVYSGSVYQKGHGIGSYLGGLFRCVFPLLRNGSTVLGSELMKSGVNILSDISRNEDPEVVIKKRGKETINNIGQIIGEKMFGKGYTTHQNLKRLQLPAGSQTVKKVKQSNSRNKKEKNSKQKKHRKTRVEEIGKNNRKIKNNRNRAINSIFLTFLNKINIIDNGFHKYA